jgi:hypothetical protein
MAGDIERSTLRLKYPFNSIPHCSLNQNLKFVNCFISFDKICDIHFQGLKMMIASITIITSTIPATIDTNNTTTEKDGPHVLCSSVKEIKPHL